MIDIKEALLLQFKHFLIKKTSGSGANNEVKQNEQLVEELHKPVHRKFNKIKFYSSS